MAEQIEIVISSTPEADAVKDKIEALVVAISDGQWSLGKKFVELGVTLLEVRSKQHWKAWGFASFGAYIDSVTAKLDRGRAQLYGYIGCAEKLLPKIGDEGQLVEMGISRALELVKVVNAGKVITPALLVKALDQKVGLVEFKAAVAGEAHIDNLEHGKWRDLGGFYASEEEWAEIQRGFDIAARVDPIIAHDAPDWIRRKEIQQRLVREFLATYEAAVMKGDA